MKNSSLKLVELTQDTVCPFCGTTVKKGACICPSCHAEHARKNITTFHYVLGLPYLFCCVVFLIFFVCLGLGQMLDLRGDSEVLFLALGALASLIIGKIVTKKGRKRLDTLGTPDWWR